MTLLFNKSVLTPDPIEGMIKGCREKNLLCQEKLYRHCYKELINLCCRYAGDLDGAGIIFNNAMLRVFKSIQNYNHDGKLMPWIKTIVINCCIDFVTKQQSFKHHPVDNIEVTIIDAAVFERVSIKEIQKTINQLPKATAVVFTLFAYEGFTHKQISEFLKISEGTSKWHVSEGRKLLKLKLEKIIKNP